MRTLVVLAGLLVPATTLAHVTLTSPPPRTTSQKQRVCGLANSARGTNVTTFAPGQTITVTWRETIDHPGHYRLSFDPCGQKFSVPETATEDTKLKDPNVIIDLIPDIQGPLPAGGRVYTQQITLPNVTCTNCTLQLIQMMTDKPPYSQNEPSDDIYYQCADITLAGNAPEANCAAAPDAGVPPDASGNPGTPDAGTGGGGNGTTGGCSTSGGAGALSLLALAGLARRRRRR